MKQSIKHISILTFAILLTILFYRQYLGLNLLIAELVFFGWLLATKNFKFHSPISYLLGGGYLLTAFFTIFTYSDFVFCINFLVVFLFVGYLIYPEAKSLTTSFKLSASNIFHSQKIFASELNKTNMYGLNLRRILSKITLMIIPIFIILLFIYLYKLSNPEFAKLVSGFFELLNKFLVKLLSIDFSLLITFLICLFISIYSMVWYKNKFTINRDAIQRDKLNMEMFNFNDIRVKNENWSAIFLFTILNVVILTLNVLEIKSVWFDFKWEGQFLKNFVHNGTYLLIISILISIGLVLYFFRGNLNFFEKNKPVKYLAYFWLSMNFILTLSVFVRNTWYVRYYALAYKRIGVYIFLVIVIYGLYTVFWKVQKGNSTFYLVRTNSFFIVATLILASLFNWDTIIAKYNFNNYEKSFVHLNFLARLPYKSLPYIDKSLDELKSIEAIQNRNFPDKGTRNYYMKPEAYVKTIEIKKKDFKKLWESKTFLSWNYPEYKAYRELSTEP